MPLRSRRIRLLIGFAVAVLIGGALVAPVVISGGSGPVCTPALTYRNVTYRARKVTGEGVVQAIAVGVGVTSGCGAQPMNVNLRSVTGIPIVRAVAVAGDQTALYVRRGLCPSASPQTLVACLKR